MKKLNISAIIQHSKKVVGYYEDLLSQGTEKDGYLYLEDDVYEQLKNKYNTQKNFPSALQQMKNVAMAARGVVSSTQFMASPEDKQKRIDICGSCPELSNGRCKVCGCNYNAKISLASSSCPKGLW